MAYAAIFGVRLVHFVFSTKNREPWIDAKIENELHAYLATAFKTAQSPALIIGGTSDHVHIHSSLLRNISMADLMETVKGDSSKWIKKKGYSDFFWQSGYGSFSIGKSSVDDLIAYIRNQKEHHKKRTFQDEYRELLRRYEVEYDERYVWD